ncbi:MAG: hypothetical protein PHP88_05590 [bacterium]|nr:hypothetical protein [bacterium]
MRKGFLIMLAVVLVAALAAPAVAGTDINGFYRAKGYVTNFKQYTGGIYGPSVAPAKDAPTSAYVEQRFRIKFTSGDENVKAVFFVETDDVWGDVNNGRNTGGQLGADAASLELKNAFVWFKVPNTSVDVTVGVQNQSDSYAGVFFWAADMGGIFVNAKVDPVALRFGWSKWTENALSKADDRTLYLAEAKFAPAKDVKVGANFYMLQDDRNRAGAAAVTGAAAYSYTDNNGLVHVFPAVAGVTAGAGASVQRVYMPGVDVTFGAGPAKINAFAFYQFGKYADYQNPATADVNIAGLAADARVDLNAGPGNAFVEALYISGGDDPATKYKSVVDAGFTNSFFARTDMQILLLNGDDIGTASGLNTSASNNMGNGGRGLTHVAGGFTMKMGDKLTGKVGAGYLAASKLLKAETAAGYKKKTMGTELNASLSYNLAKGLDVGVVGAYAFIGDFYKTSATSAGDPDNAFDLHARINYAF